MKASPGPSPQEIPTAERLARSEWRQEHLSAKPGAPTRLRNVHACELDRLYHLDVISQDDHTTLARFQKELHEAGMIFSVRSSIIPTSSAGSAALMGDRAFQRAKRLDKQMKALVKAIGEQNRRVILAAITQDWPLSKDAKDILHKAALALQPLYEA